MHNINYLDLANEALPDEVYDNEKEFNNFKISYKKEIKLGETVKCKYSFVNNTHVICVKSEDDTKLHSVIEFLQSYFLLALFNISNNLSPLRVKSITSLIKIEIIYPLNPSNGTKK